MSEGVFPVGRVDVGLLSGPFADNFRRQSSGVAAGTAGLVIGTAGKAGRLYRLRVVNGGATAYFLQVFNKATAPSNTDVPVWCVRLPASGDVEVNLADVNGLPCAAGMGFAISSTAGTLTLAAATDIAFWSAVYTQQS